MGLSRAEKQERRYVVYFLRCPLSKLVRYVGMTSNPRARAVSHATPIDGCLRKVEWIRELKSRGLRPILEVKTPEMSLGAAESLERRLIKLVSLHSPNQIFNGVEVDEPTSQLCKINASRANQTPFARTNAALGLLEGVQ